MPQHPLIRLLLAHAGGSDAVPHRPTPPPHLSDLNWKHVCECGYTWHSSGDAVWRDSAWLPPRKQCVGCHQWITGQPVTSAGN